MTDSPSADAAEPAVEPVPDSTSGARKGKRAGIAVYRSNPFIKQAAATAKVGSKRLSSRDGCRFMIVSQDGEIMAPAGFHEIVEVDKSQFVKLYVNGVKAFAGLKPAGARVFEVIYLLVSQSPGADRVWVHFSSIDQAATPMSYATFARGMRELLEMGFLAESETPSMYWLNIDYLFNGNRLAFIKEYRLASVKGDRRSSDQAQREALEMAGQQRIDDAAIEGAAPT